MQPKPKLILSFLLLAALPNFCSAQEPRLQLPVGHMSGVVSLYSSDDGNLVASAAFKDQNLAIWDVKTGRLLSIIEKKFSTRNRYDVAFSHDNSKVYLASWDSQVGFSNWIWDIKNNRPLLNLDELAESKKVLRNEIPESILNSTDPLSHTPAAFSYDNRFLAVAATGYIKVIDLQLGYIIATLRTGLNSNKEIAFSQDGKFLQCGSKMETTVWRTSDYSKAFFFKNGERVFFTPGDSRMIVAGKNDIDIYAVGNTQVDKQILLPMARTLAFNTDRNQMLAVAGTRSILFDIASGKALHQWDSISDAWFHPFDHTIITTKGGKYKVMNWSDADTNEPKENAGRKIEIWDPVTFLRLQSWKDIKNRFFFLDKAGDKVFYHEGGIIRVRNINSGSLLREWNSQGHIPYYSVNISPDSKKIITRSDVTHYTNMWDIETGAIIGSASSGGKKVENSNPAKFIFAPDNSSFFSIKNEILQLISSEGKLLLQSQKKYTGHISAAFSNHSKKAALFYQNKLQGRLEIYDLSSFRLVNQITLGPDPLYDTDDWSLLYEIAFSPDDSLLLLSYDTKNITEIRRVTDFKPVKTIKGIIGITERKFNFNGKQVITISRDLYKSYVWNIEDGKPLSTYKGVASFSPVENKVVTNYGIIIDLSNNGKRVFLKDYDTSLNSSMPPASLAPNGSSMDPAHFSPDGRKIIETTVSVGSMGATHYVSVWDVQTGKPLTDNDSEASGNHISPSGKKILYIKGLTEEGIDSTMEIVDFDKKDTIRLPASPDDFILLLALFSADDKYLLTATEQTVKKWETATGKLLYTFFPVDSVDFLTMIPTGYYLCSQDAARTLHYVNGMQVIGFNQLDIRYNRPDKVMEHNNYPDRFMISAYQEAWKKRVKKLNVDTSLFTKRLDVPVADFLNRDSFGDEYQKERLPVHINAADSSSFINQFNIWVNEVPLYGQNGLSILRRKIKYFDTTIAIQLSQGENRIETSVTNVNGTESYRMPLIVNYTPAVKQKEKTYFIGIGIDKFANPEYNLSYSSKDIRDLSAKLKQKYGNDISIDTLFNENVTVGNIKALKQKLLQTTVNDRVIISYSGHGLLSKAYDYFLSTYSVNFTNPEENGLPYDEFENLLDNIPARKKLMLIDACHSGEVDKEDFQKVKINKAALDANHIVSKGAEISNTDEGGTKKLGLKNSFELMQNLFVNVGKSTGATIISAAAGTEFALENGNLKNGVFTYCLLEALGKYPTMKISELKKRVGARVEELTSGMQKPTSRNEAIAVDWKLW